MSVTDDRQTDRAMEKCAGAGGVACAAAAIPPKKDP